MNEACARGHTEGRYKGGQCKVCVRASLRASYHRHGDRRRAEAYKRRHDNVDLARRRELKAHLKRTFGITLEQYDELLASQDGRCAICRSDNPGSEKVRWHVDHCHETGIVRGLLCVQCNVMIAMAKDNIDVLENAKTYLGAFKCH